jgi:hypothetical protein
VTSTTGQRTSAASGWPHREGWLVGMHGAGQTTSST